VILDSFERQKRSHLEYRNAEEEKNERNTGYQRISLGFPVK